VSVVNNEAQHRFELEEQGELAFASYRKADDVYTIPHVEAAMALRGKGSAGRLMAGIAEMARAKGFKIKPTCPYAVAWFRRNPDAQDVMA
jgi:predicted GNAT family acetyltransferase